MGNKQSEAFWSQQNEKLKAFAASLEEERKRMQELVDSGRYDEEVSEQVSTTEEAPTPRGCARQADYCAEIDLCVFVDRAYQGGDPNRELSPFLSAVDNVRAHLRGLGWMFHALRIGPVTHPMRLVFTRLYVDPNEAMSDLHAMDGSMQGVEGVSFAGFARVKLRPRLGHLRQFYDEIDMDRED